MKLENQVCSLELAKKLKELGVEQESLYRHVAYVDYGNGQKIWSPSGWYLLSKDDSIFKRASIDEEWCSAFTVAELTEFLIQHKHNFLPYFCDNPRERCWVYNFGQYPEYVSAETLADCLAKMIIHLIENKLIQL